MKNLLKAFFCFFLLFSFQSSIAQIVYVDASNTGEQNGEKWETAFTTIQQAIDAAEDGEEIWIAKGEYMPVSTTETFLKIEKNFNLFGGFEGKEDSKENRNYIFNETIISAPEDTIFKLEKINNINILLDGLTFKNSKKLLSTLQSENNRIEFKNCKLTLFTDPYLINIENSNIYIENSIIEKINGGFSGTFSSLKINKSKFRDNNGYLVSGHLSNNFEFLESNLTNNNNGIYLIQNGNNKKTSCLINNSLFENNNSGSFIYLSNINTINITNSVFSNNKSENIFQVKADNLNIDNCSFNKNNSCLFYAIPDRFGGAVGDISFKNCNFIKNLKQFSSGFKLQFIIKKSFSNCKFSENDYDFTLIDSQGNETHDLNIENCEFNDNYSNQLINFYGKFLIKNVNISNTNQTKIISNCIVGYSSTIDSKIENINLKDINCQDYCIRFPSGSILSIINSNFRNLYSSKGIISSGIKTEIENCNFDSTRSTGENFNGIISLEGSLEKIIRNCTFLNNITSGNTINTYSGLVKIYNSYFTGNKLNSPIFGMAGNSVYLFNSKFINNQSPSYSIGTDNGSHLKAENCSFVNNEFGGFTHTSMGSSCFINNCLFYGNKLIESSNETVFSISGKFSNSIIWNNSHPCRDIGSYKTLSLNNCNIQGGFPGKNILDVDPKFIDPENDDFRLSCQSPLLNKGSNQFVTTTTDLDGNPRIVGDSIDIGPYEFQADPDVANAIPEPTFIFSNSAPCINEEIQILNKTENKDYFTYKWNLGDGSPLYDSTSIKYKYGRPGNYSLKLTATNGCGRSKDTILSLNVKPSFVPQIFYPTTVCASDTISFSTNANCSLLEWTVTGGTIVSGQGTDKILVKWGDGISGKGKIRLFAGQCGNAGVCELPIEITIPILPSQVKISGKQIVCKGLYADYRSSIKDFIPGAVYNWSVKGGEISGDESGYGLDSIHVNWNTIDSVGFVYLNIIHELLPCSIADTFPVNIRPQVKILNNSTKFCAGSSNLFLTEPEDSFTWKISGANNLIENSGKANFGADSGSFVVSAFPVNTMKFCNTENSLNFDLIGKPVIDSVGGVTEVDTITVYKYKVYYRGPESSAYYYVYNPTNYWVDNNNHSIRWSGNEPYGFYVNVNPINPYCPSDTFHVPIKKDIIYKVTAPDTICIDQDFTCTLNTDPFSPATYSWKLNGNSIGENSSEITLRSLVPGRNILTAEIQRKGRYYKASKTILVNAADGKITIKGPSVISPSAEGNYVYKIENTTGLPMEYSTEGASSAVLKGDSIQVTWKSEGPYSLKVWGKNADLPCTSLPAIINVQKARVLNPQIASGTGDLCLNSSSEFSLDTDDYTQNVQWNLSGGGTIIKSDEKGASVLWGDVPGEYDLTVTYDRFGKQSLVRKIQINPLPAPVIKNVVLCEGSSVTLETTNSFQSYKWSSEPENVLLGIDDQVNIVKGGYYKVQATDANGCSGISTILVRTIPKVKTRISAPVNKEICQGTGSRNITLTTPEGNGYKYQWYSNEIPVSDSDNPVLQVSQDLAVPATVTYKVIATVEGCTDESSITFRVYPESSCSNGSVPGGGGSGEPGGGTGGENCTDKVSFTLAGCSPVSIQNKSLQDSGFKWYFGDGSTSTEKQPGLHTYKDIGIYNITLDNGCARTSSLIEVPVLAKFEVPDKVCAGSKVSFKDYSVNLPLNKIESWEWNFGDGNIYEGTGTGSRDTSHTFSTPGEYTVILTVRAKNGTGGDCSSSDTVKVSVTPLPVVDFTASEQICNSTLFRFTNNSTQQTTEAKYVWTLGEGLSSGSKNTAAEYKTAGTKSVTLKVTDFLQCAAEKSLPVDVKAPVAAKKIITGENLKICLGDSILLTSPSGENGYKWFRNNAELSNNSQTMYAKEAGIYKVSYIESGCSLTTNEVTVQQFNLDNATVKFDAPACNEDNLKISVPEADRTFHTIHWMKDNSILPFNTTEFTIEKLSTADNGQYLAVVTEKISGCQYVTPAKQLFTNEKPSRPLIAATRKEVCYNESTAIVNNNLISDKNYTWYNNNQVQNSSGDTLKLNFLTSSVIVNLKITDPVTGCSSLSEELVIKTGKDLHPILSGDINACERTYARININLAAKGYTYKWFRNDSLLSNTLSRMDFASLSLKDSGKYSAIITSEGEDNVKGCSYLTDTVSVNIKKAPVQPEILGGKEYCKGTKTVLTSTVTDNIVWNTGETTPSITVYRQGSYYVTATDKTTGCSVKNTVYATENPVPDLSFISGGEYQRCSNEPIEFAGLNEYPDYQWYFNGASQGKTNVPVYPRKSGKYTVTVTNDKGCTSISDTIRIQSLLCGCVVFNTEDSEEPGTLREAIKCANRLPGIDNIIFQMEETGPFVFKIDSVLPAFTQGAIIDGFTQSGEGIYDIIIEPGLYNKSALVIESNVTGTEITGLHIRDFQNAVSINSGADETTIEKNKFTNPAVSSVSVNGLTSNSAIKNNEFESNGKGEALSLSYSNNAIITDNKFAGYKNPVVLNNSDNNLIRNNNFTNSTGNTVTIRNGSDKNKIVSNTLFKSDSSAIVLSSSSENFVSENLIGLNASEIAGGIGKYGIRLQDAANTRIEKNTITGTTSDGMNIKGSSGSQITANLIGRSAKIESGTGGDGINADEGIAIKNNTIHQSVGYAVNISGNSQILENIISDNGKGGIYVVSDSVTISRNEITSSVSKEKAIDLHNFANGRIKPGWFTDHKTSQSSVTISGTSIPGDSIEIFHSEVVPQQAKKFLKTVAAPDGKWSLTIPAGPFYNPDTRNYYVNTATQNNRTSELSGTYPTGCYNCICKVENLNDTGAGSLRAAIDSVHTGVCRIINFSVESGTIALDSSLRKITVPMIIQGKDAIVLKGKKSGTALTIESENSAVHNLSFENWNKGLELNGDNTQISGIKINNTILPVLANSNNNKIESSCINCQSDTSSPFLINNGIVVKGNNNSIGTTGKPNVFKDASTGITVDAGTGNKILYNTFTNSEKAIHHLNSGNKNYPAPVEMIALFTSPSTGVLSGKSGVGDRIQIFISDYTGKPVHTFAGELTAESEKWSFTVPPAFINAIENTYLVITATDANGNTSELSKPVKLGNKPTYCYVTNTLNTGKGSLRSAVECANQAGKGEGAPAVIAFRLSSSAINTIPVADSGFVLTNNYGVTIDPGAIQVQLKGNSKLPYAFSFVTDNNSVRNLSFSNFRTAISVNDGFNITVSGNSFSGNDTAISATGNGKIFITENTITEGISGIYISKTNADITKNTLGKESGNSISNAGIVLINANGSQIKENRILNSGNTGNDTYSGKALFIEGGNSYLIIKNTILTKTSTENTGIVLENVSRSEVRENIFTNGKTGLELKNSEKLNITQNSFNNISEKAINLIKSAETAIKGNTTTGLGINGKPIVLNYKNGDESNTGIQPPAFNYATYKKGNLYIKGKSKPFSAIEIFETDSSGRDLLKLAATLQADQHGIFEYVTRVNPVHINAKTFRATNTIGQEFLGAGMNIYTSEASLPFNPDLKLCFVTSESDENKEGTLRYNIHLANKEKCNLMLFEVPGKSMVSISPDSALPVIKSINLTIDGTSQPGYNNNPVVQLNNPGGLNTAFSVKSKGTVAIHGFELNNYDDAVVLDSLNNFEFTVSSFRNYSRNAFVFNTKNHESIVVDSSLFYSPSVPTGLLINTPEVTLRGDSINAGSVNAIVVQNNNVKLISNRIGYNNPVSGNPAVKAADADSLVADGNRISGYNEGIYVKNLNGSAVINNQFLRYDTTNILKYAVKMENSRNSKILGTEISRADSGIIVKTSRKVTCNGNQIFKVKHTGIYVSDCDSAEISSNDIGQSVYGIQLSRSGKTLLKYNRVYFHDSAGVVIDKLSDSVKIVANRIGSPALENTGISKGAGLVVYSSDNIIGLPDTLANTFSNNFKGGVIVNGGNGNRIAYNIFFNNDSIVTRPVHFAIDHINNGNKFKEKPRFDSFVNGEKKGVFIISGKAESGNTVHIYRSEGYYQNARYFVGEAIADSSGKWTFRLDTADSEMFRKPFKNKTITLVATATDKQNNTSELSDILYIGTCFVTNNSDNTDNEYPYPNSLRQAVACANSQPEKAVIKFAIDGFTGFDIPVKQEMISLVNSHGLNFDGGNILNKGVPVKVFNSSSKTSLFWEITESAGPSEFRNFKIQNFDTAVYLKTPHKLNVDRFQFLEASISAIVTGDSVKDCWMDSLVIDDSKKGGLLIAQNSSGKIFLTASEIKNTSFGVKADNCDSLYIAGNSFRNTLNGVVAENLKLLNITSNNFKSDTLGAIIWKKSKGKIEKNEFDEDTVGTVVSIINSKNVTFSSNKFKKEIFENLYLKKVDSSFITDNSFGKIKSNAVLLDSCNHVLVKENIIDSTGKKGFEVLSSKSIRFSRNIISEVHRKNETILININKNITGKSSNKNHAEPVFKGYIVQRKGSCSDEHLGIYLSGEAVKNDLVEIFFSDTLHTTFKEFIGEVKADSNGNWLFRLPKNYYQRNPKYIYSFTATGTDSSWNSSVEARPYRFANPEHRVVVKYTADNKDSLTLRAAVDEINCSDIFTRVVFEIDEPAPHKIVLKDTLPVLNAFRGFSIDGNTQAIYNVVKERKNQDSSITIVGSSHPLTTAIFRVHEQSDSSAFENINITDAARAFTLSGKSNKIINVKIVNSGTVKGDTAVSVIKSGGNSISSSTISGYRTGVHLTNETAGNSIVKGDFSNVKVAVLIDKKSNGNKISENNILPDSLGVLIKSVEKQNKIQKNTFGSLSSPLTVTGIKLQNADMQEIISNNFPAGKSPLHSQPVAFIELGDSCNSNTIKSNKIGINSLGYSEYSSDMIGIIIKPVTAGIKNFNNIVEHNQIANLKLPAIVLDNVQAGSIQGNFLGTDSALVQMNKREDYRDVSGIDTTAIVISSSELTQIIGNTIINFKNYGMDVIKSDKIVINTNRIFSEKSNLNAVNLNLDSPIASNNNTRAPRIDSVQVLTVDTIILRGNTIYPNSEVEIFEGFTYKDDTSDHALRRINTVKSDASGNFSIQLPSSSFGYDKYNKYVAQVTTNKNSSEMGKMFIIKSMLCKLIANKIDLIDTVYTPCPGSNFEIDSKLVGLTYKWSSPDFEDTIRTRIAHIDSSAVVRLEISDSLCKHTEDFKVRYKKRPLEPRFAVSSNNFVGDTIVLVDVSGNNYDKYTWNSSAPITIVSTKDGTTPITGPDGKTYPGGKEIRFIAPAEGVYTIEQISILDSCSVTLTKDIKVTYKDPTISNPYDPAKGFKSLVVYPSPLVAGSTTNAFITTTSKDEIEVEVTDIQKGSSVFYTVLSGKLNYNVPLDLSDLAAGTYIVKVTASNSVLVSKIVIAEKK